MISYNLWPFCAYKLFKIQQSWFFHKVALEAHNMMLLPLLDTASQGSLTSAQNFLGCLGVKLAQPVKY